jgi:hypothetical protein
MKKLFSILLLNTLSAAAIAQGGLSWSAPVSVAPGFGNYYPRITLMNNDLPLVTWEGTTSNFVYASRFNGTSFNTPIPVNPSDLTPFIANWAGAEVASSGDTAFVVFSSMPAETGHVYTVRTINGGLSFEDTVRVDLPDPGFIPRFPGIAVAPGGNPVVYYMRIESSLMIDSEFAVSRSLNGGSSFQPAIVPTAANPESVCDCCPATLAISGNNHALLYRNNDNDTRNIWAAFSSDNSASYPVLSEIDHTNWNINSCPSSGPSAVIIGDSLYYSWMSDATGDSRVYLGAVNINDQNESPNRMVFPSGTTSQNFPVIAGSGDTLGLIWQNYIGSTPKILFTYSTTGMAGLGASIDTLTLGWTGVQFRPDLAFRNGKFHVVFSDSYSTSIKYISAQVAGAIGVSENSNTLTNFVASQNGNDIYISFNSKQNKKASAEVITVAGQLISSHEILVNAGKNTLSVVAPAAAGLYLIVIKADNGTLLSKKFLVK